MTTFYRISIETFDGTGATIKHYKRDCTLFSKANVQYQKALAAAKKSDCDTIIACLNRHQNGYVSHVAYFER